MTTTQEKVTTAVRVNMAIRRERQADVAKVLGVTQAAVSYRLSGRIRWTLEDLDRLAEHYGCGTADLVSPPGMWLGEQRTTAAAIGTGRNRRRSAQRIGGAVITLPLPRTAFEQVAA